MCEFLSKLTTPEITDIITMLIALASAWLLYKTFESQKASTQIAKEVSIIDRKAKRAEYLPEIRSKILPIYPKHELSPGKHMAMPYNGDITTIIAKIIFKNNAVQLIDFKNDSKDEGVNITLDPFPFDLNQILISGNYLEIKYTINLKNYFEYLKKENKTDVSDDIYILMIKPHKKLIFRNKLYFSDMIGNKYELGFIIRGLEELIISNLKMID